MQVGGIYLQVRGTAKKILFIICIVKTHEIFLLQSFECINCTRNLSAKILRHSPITAMYLRAIDHITDYDVTIVLL